MNRLIKSIIICIAWLFIGSCPIWAMGVSDFVGVADSVSSALYNPAGLATLEEKSFLLEHRFSGRDLAVGWDDSLIYLVSESRGTGALYIAQSQDLIGIELYNRHQAFGYSYGWYAFDKIAVGISGKFCNYGIYNKYLGTYVKEVSSKDFLLDFGMLVEVTDSFKIGLAVHNIGRDDSIQTMNYQSTIGCSYQIKNIVVAAEIYDFLNEGKAGSNPMEGSLMRLGGRINLGSNIRLHAIVEEDLTDWDYSGKMLGIEFNIQDISIGVSWYQGKGSFIDDALIQATINYKF